MQGQFTSGPQPPDNVNNHMGPLPPQARFPEKPRPGFDAAHTVVEEPTSRLPSFTPAPTRAPQPPRKGKGKKRVLVAGALGVLIVLALVYFFVSKSSANVTLYQADVQNVTQYIGGGGIVSPLQELVVSYPSAEQALGVLVKPGDTVSLNQPLIRLDPTQINIQIKQASDDLAAAQAYLNSVTSGGSTVAVAQAQQQYNIAKDRYNALVSQSSSLMQHGGNLVASMAGVVTEVDINPGQVFAANTPLLTIMDESSVIVHVKVPLANLGQVHVGQDAEVTPSALPNTTLKGQVASIIPQADPQTDTFEVWVEVPNPDKNLLPGMSAFVRIQSSGQAVVVPRLAVLNPDQDSAVFVVRNGQAFLQHVHVVGRSVNAVYIDSGLSARDEVVLVGAYNLHDGQRVHVVGVEKAIS